MTEAHSLLGALRNADAALQDNDAIRALQAIDAATAERWTRVLPADVKELLAAVTSTLRRAEAERERLAGEVASAACSRRAGTAYASRF
jgi:hypothetical protein